MTPTREVLLDRHRRAIAKYRTALREQIAAEKATAEAVERLEELANQLAELDPPAPPT